MLATSCSRSVGDPHFVTAAALERRAAPAGLRVEHTLGGRLWHFTRLVHG